MTVKGLYQDRSSAIKTYHHFKLDVQSPSFEQTTIDIKYSRDDFEIKLDFQVEHAKQPYGLILKYSIQSDHETISFAELNVGEKFYRISANMLSQQPKQLTVEIHIDK